MSIITKGLIGQEDLSIGAGTFTRTTSTGGTNTLTKIGAGVLTAGNLYSIIFVDGVKYTTIPAALAALPATGGIVYVTTPGIYSSAGASIGGTNGSGNRVYLWLGPNVTWKVTSQVIVGAESQIVGADRNGSVIQADSTFPINTAVVRLGPGTTFDQGSRLTGVTIDCNGVSGCQGVYSNSINENAGVFNSAIKNNLGHGILIDMSGGANFAENFSLDDVEIFPTSVSGAVHGIYLRNSGAFSGSNFKVITKISVVGIGAGTLGDALRIENVTGGDVIGVHGEKVTTVAHIASTGGGQNTSNINLSDITGANTGTGTNVVLVDATSTNIDIKTVTRMFGTTFVNTIQDNASSPTRTVVGDSILAGTLFITGSYHIGPVTLNGLVTAGGVLPLAAGANDLGSTALPFGNLWLSAGANSFKFQPVNPAAARVITIADPLSPSTVGLPLLIASGTSTLTANAALAAVTSQAAITTAGTGILTTDAIEWSYASAPTAGDSLCHVSPYVTAGNVNFVRTNPTAAPQNVSAIVINWRVIR